MADISTGLQEQVRDHLERKAALRIRGQGSKQFYGRDVDGDPLELSGHSGIAQYDPSELVVKVRAGTPLRELETALDEQGQMLPFEPPRFADGGTIGGTVACGLSGPRRPWAGAVRDYVLGARVLTGKGEIISFGGEVMKNVAGYDGFRLMSGALGTLGVLLDVSLKVLPKPEHEISLAFEMSADSAIQQVNEWSAQPVPLSGAAHEDGCLRIRLAASEATLDAMHAQLGGETDRLDFWTRLRDQQLDFFESEGSLWRLSLPPTTTPLDLPGRWLLDWGGAQRWWTGTADCELLRGRAADVGGHATLFRGGDHSGEVFQPLPEPMLALQRRLKAAFDPKRILNPGRMYSEL